MKAKLLIILGVIVFFVLAISLNEYNHNPLAWCFKDRNVCTLEAMDKLRNERDSIKKGLQDQMKATDDHFNPIIEGMKPTLDGATIEAELKAGRNQNVPKGIISLRNAIVPLAMADDSHVFDFIDDTKRPEAVKLTAFLKSKGAPFAGVDILHYGQEAGLTKEQTALLIGISKQEASWGMAYTSTRKGYRESVPEMEAIYHNPVGQKWCTNGEATCPEANKKPDENGMWIQKYDSYDQFWENYTRQMKRGYFDKGATTPEQISKCYVKGDCVDIKQGWADSVRAGMNDVLNAIK